MSSMDETQVCEYEKVAIDVALIAGQMIAKSSGKDVKIEEKLSRVDLVTEVDKTVESFTFEALKRRFPNHKFVGEETTEKKIDFTDDPTWIVDPIDGTMNFIHTFPYVCISIGLAVNKQLILGVIYSPFLDKLYTAKKGHGAFCNGKPIHVRDCHTFENALALCGMPLSASSYSSDALSNIEAVAWKCHGVRCVGSSALELCYVASGFADVYWHFGLHCWDMAAAAVILTEAGGCVIDTEGGSFQLFSRRLIGAGNEQIAKALSKELKVHLKFESD